MTKLFQTLKKLLAFIAIEVSDAGVKNLAPFFSFVWGLFWITCFVIIEAETFEEYSESFYALSTLLANVTSPIILLEKSAKILKLIDHLENVIEEREIVCFIV